MNADGIIMHETPLFQYCYHVSERSVQCAIRTENSETAISRVST